MQISPRSRYGFSSVIDMTWARRDLAQHDTIRSQSRLGEDPRGARPAARPVTYAGDSQADAIKLASGSIHG